MDATDRRPLSKTAIAIGLAVDLVGTIAIAMSVFFVAAIVVAAKRQNVEGVMDDWFQDTTVLVTLMLIGVLGTVAGGFVTGKVAGRDHIRHAVWMGAILTVFAAILELLPDDGQPEPLWITAAGYVLTLPAAVVGGALARPRQHTTP